MGASYLGRHLGLPHLPVPSDMGQVIGHATHILGHVSHNCLHRWRDRGRWGQNLLHSLDRRKPILTNHQTPRVPGSKIRLISERHGNASICHEDRIRHSNCSNRVSSLDSKGIIGSNGKRLAYSLAFLNDLTRVLARKRVPCVHTFVQGKFLASGGIGRPG